MSFGKSFKTLGEAKTHIKILKERSRSDVAIRKLKKSLFPRRKKLYHVGTYLDFLNFA